jgi:hypothetical protein
MKSICTLALFVVLPIAALAQASAQPWPTLPANVESACTDAAFVQMSSLAISAVRAGDYAKASILAKRDGEDMGACYATYRHPKYLLYQGTFYSVSSLAKEKSGQGKALDLVNVAQDDLRAVSAYALPPDMASEYGHAQALLAKSVYGSADALGPLPAYQAAPTSDLHSTVAQTLSPIVVTKCAWNFDNPKGDNWDITVAISFQNVSETTVTDAKFKLLLLDAFGKELQTESGTVSGTFSPGNEIKPRTGIDGRYFTQPDAHWPSSPAWDVDNYSTSQVKRVRCVLEAAAFSDGTSWSAATP